MAHTHSLGCLTFLGFELVTWISPTVAREADPVRELHRLLALGAVPGIGPHREEVRRLRLGAYGALVCCLLLQIRVEPVKLLGDRTNGNRESAIVAWIV